MKSWHSLPGWLRPADNLNALPGVRLTDIEQECRLKAKQFAARRAMWLKHLEHKHGKRTDIR